MPIGVVIEFLGKIPQKIQQKIKSKIVLIDFKNGNILDFLEYIGKGITRQKEQWRS